jgi:hypothetical protein
MRTFIQLFTIVSLLVVAAFLACGCGKKLGGGAKAFESASAEIKATLDKGLAEARAKDYAEAITTLQGLYRTPGLTPDQTKALEETITAISDEMYAASNKGDAKATEAIKVLRQRQRR